MPELKSKYDAIVIGSGASGAVMAYELANKGLSVLILEKGRWNKHDDFSHDELAMYAKLYKMAGLQTTKDNDTTIAQGQTVGGSTVVNNAIWYRANLDNILPFWGSFGAHIPKEEIETAYNYLEDKLKVKKIKPEEANSSSQLFLDACKRLHIDAHLLDHNRHQCLGCGWCNFGCQYNRKTSMLVTFIPWALEKGAHLLDDVQNATIIKKNGIATGVSFMRNNTPHLIPSDKIIICAGAIGSSEILLKSKINPNRNVGKGLHFLGGFFVNALMNQKLDAFDGIGLSCITHASQDYMIETFHSPPGIFSLTLGAWFEEHHQLMLKYPNMAQAGVMVGSQPTGSIKLDKKSRPVIDFKYSKQDLKNFKEGLKSLATIFFEAGAKKVIPASFKTMIFNNPNDLQRIDKEIKTNDDLIIGSAHPQGGNRMSDDPKKGVVNSQFEVHKMTNLYIADTSVFPKNIWANCQATTMAMSKYASKLISS